MNTSERFWSHVAKSDGCWLWTGYVNPNGYGEFRVSKKLLMRAHRFAFEEAHGELPQDGRVLDHLCRTRHCVRPDHLEVVTRRENSLRGASPLIRAFHEGTCVRGHPKDAANAYIRPDGYWSCRACATIRRPRYQKDKAV